MSFLVDTDRVVDYLKGRQDALALLNRLYADGLAVSVVTYAEVYEGIYYGSDPRRNELAFRRFLEGVPVLGINRAVARRFASIRGELRAISGGFQTCNSPATQRRRFYSLSRRTPSPGR